LALGQLGVDLVLSPLWANFESWFCQALGKLGVVSFSSPLGQVNWG